MDGLLYKNKALILTFLFFTSLIFLLTLIISFSNKNKAQAEVLVNKEQMNQMLKNNNISVKKVKVVNNIKKSSIEEEEKVTKPVNKDSKKIDVLTLTLNPPKDYKRMKTYTQNCDSRPEGTSCIKFGDDYTVLISENSKGYKEIKEVDGYTTVKVFGETQNYYHILGTDLIKVEPLSMDSANETNVNIDIYKDFKLVNKGSYLSLFPGLSEIPDFIPEPYEAMAEEINPDFYYSYFMIGNDIDNIITVASKKGNGYESLYIDFNNNQKLSDEKPIIITDSKIVCDVKLPLKITGSRNIKGDFNVCLQKNGDKITYFPSSYYYKEISIDGNQYKSVVMENLEYDNNADGLYHNSGIWVDVNLDKRFTKDEHFSDGDILPIGEKNTYKISLRYP